MDSEFRLCPACRAPNTVQDAACTACGTRMPAVSKAPVPTFDTIPGRQEARAAARTGVRRGLLVGIASAAALGLLVARTFRSPSLQAVAAPAASTYSPIMPPQPRTTPPAETVSMMPTVPIAPAGLGVPNPYSSPNPNPYASPNPYSSEVAAITASPSPSPEASSAPAISIAAPDPSTRPAPAAGGANAKPAAYTDADLERIRNEAEEPAPASEDPPVVASPSPRRPPPSGEEREARLRERRDAVRAAQRRADEAQGAIDDIRREARENDDDGLQEELNDALAELKAAQRDLSRAQRALKELEDPARPVLPAR
jgi:hypothetical protein